jgi:nitrogen regulatory protein P-II 1
MKKIEAIIRPEKLTETIKGLEDIGVTGVTIIQSQIVGKGRKNGFRGVYRGKNYSSALHPKIKLEIVLSDYLVKPTIRSIVKSAQTGEDGDGKLYVYSVLEAYNIKTGTADYDLDGFRTD